MLYDGGNIKDRRTSGRAPHVIKDPRGDNGQSISRHKADLAVPVLEQPCASRLREHGRKHHEA